MDIRTMDSLSMFDEWDDNADADVWWTHPLYNPKRTHSLSPASRLKRHPAVSGTRPRSA